MFTGTGSQTGTNGRWGDYSMTTIDPADGMTFWHVNEYYATNSSFNWHTRIGKFNFAGGGQSPTPTPTATPPASCSWAAGPDMPSAGTRLAGVFFPANGKFYAMGGRSPIQQAASSLIRLNTILVTNSWTTKSATYPDTHVTTWPAVCLTTLERTTSTAWAVRRLPYQTRDGSRLPLRSCYRRHQHRLLLPTGPLAMRIILPGGFTVFNNKLYILGGFDIILTGSSDQPDLGVYSQPSWLGAEEYRPASSARLHTHDHHRQPHLHRWRQRYHGWRSHRYYKLLCL